MVLRPKASDPAEGSDKAKLPEYSVVNLERYFSFCALVAKIFFVLILKLFILKEALERLPNLLKSEITKVL